VLVKDRICAVVTVILSICALAVLVNGLMWLIFADFRQGAESVLFALFISSVAGFFYFLSVIRE
jgi:hypothetical protein